MAEINQQQEVKDAVQAAVKSGIDVHKQIKLITPKSAYITTIGYRQYQTCYRGGQQRH